MSALWRQARRRARIPDAVKQAARGRAGRHDLSVGNEVGTWRDVVDGRAPRLGARQLIGRGAARSGRFAAIDPLVTPRLPSKTDLLAFGIWAGVLGYAGRKAWKQHGGLEGARAELRGEAPPGS